MLKQLFCCTATISLAFVPFASKSAFARPLSIIYQYPEVLNPQTNSSICYLETIDGRTLNLNTLCTKKVEKGTSLIPVLKPVNSSTQTRNLRTSNNSITTKCYFVDNNGRPCNTNN